MLNGKVSIIIPTYNCADYISQSIESAIAQSFDNIEIIVVNDGSTDATKMIVAKYFNDDRVRYVEQTNQGIGTARNSGIRLSTGDFIAFLDADDIWDGSKLQKQMPFFADPAIGLVYSDWRYIDQDGKDIEYNLQGEYLRHRFGAIAAPLFFDNFIATPSVVLKRECLNAVGLFDETIAIGEDWDLWLRIAFSYSVAYCPEKLLAVRIQRPGKITYNVELRHKCTDAIREKIISRYAHMLSKKVIRKSRAYSFCQRGYYYRSRSFFKALGLYVLAINSDLNCVMAWKGIVKLIAFYTLQTIKTWEIWRKI